MALVGEQGPELVHLPRGSQVTPAQQTASMGKSGMGGTTVNIYSPKDLNPIETARIMTNTMRSLAFEGVL